MVKNTCTLAGSLLLPFLVASTTTSCSDLGSRGSYLVRDSAGVRVVETQRPAWEEGEGWAVSREPILEIGEREGEGPLQFYWVTGGMRLADGGIAILNNGTKTIRIFAADGRFMRGFGGEGEGPGEVRTLTAGHVLAGDTLLIWDRQLRRVSFFTSTGEFVESHLLNWVGPGQPTEIEPLPDGRLLLETYDGSGRSPGIFRGVALLLVFDPRGFFLDTIGIFPSIEEDVKQTGYRLAPFNKDFFFDVWQESIITGTAEELAVSAWDATGVRKAVFRYPGMDLTVQLADKEWYHERYWEIATTPEAEQEISQMLKNVQFPETKAAYSELKVDPEGNVWLRTGRNLFYYAESRERTVFSSEGVLLGAITLPESFTVLEIGVDEILGVWRDELDAEFVRVYRIQKGNTGQANSASHPPHSSGREDSDDPAPAGD
jgi:hypothetical protein